MTKRIFRAILTVSLVVLFSCLVLIVGVLYRYFEIRVESELRSETEYIAQGVQNEGARYFHGLKSTSRITWVAANGNVIYDNREAASTMENHAGRREIQEALKTGMGRSVRYSKTLGQKTIYFALRLNDGTVLRVSEAQYSVWALVFQALQPAAMIVLIACILAGIIASRAARQIVRPINELDLSSPGGQAECYDELTPLLARIRSQNRQIEQQMYKLRSGQKEFAAITENMNEGFLVLDLKAHVLSYNSAALRLLDAPDVPWGTSAYVLSEELGFRNAVDQALAGRRVEQLLEKDDRCCQVIASPVFQDGHLNGVALVILDITEKEQRENLRREFTANVSHELKTPLTSISGTAEILENGLVKPEDIPHFAANIHKEAGRLINLVNDIIRLSRLDEGGFTAEWCDCDLYQMAKDILERLHQTAEKKQVSLNLQGTPLHVRAVPQILEEILYNLCDNAVKYNHAGGSVTVRIERNSREVAVMDNGAGIAPEIQDRIFERFYRGDKSRCDRGTGLGLSIVKHGAAYLGAKVRLKSKVGQGSSFILTFPHQEET